MAIKNKQPSKYLPARLAKSGAIEMGQQADKQLDKLLLKRVGRLASVKRFILLWVGLFVLLILTTFVQYRHLSGFYQSLKPAPGGIYTEGLVGTFTNSNPIYANGAADVAVSRLVFSGLFKYDTNNQLVGDLAKDYKLSPDEKRYTVHLRHSVKWHDGRPFSASDVVFTYKTIQTLSAESALYSSWRDINVTAPDKYTVIFDLANPLSSFPYILTNGIVPEHLLKSIPPEQLRSAPFNSSPVGTGPFKWRSVETSGATPKDRQQRIGLAAYSGYWQGKPKLDGFNLQTFSSQQLMVGAFTKKQINAVSGLEVLPDDLKKDGSVQTYVTPLTSAVMAFFNNSRPILNDQNVRQALVRGIDRRKLVKLTPFPVLLIDEPILRGQLGYNPGAAQLPYDRAAAAESLQKSGWVLDASGQRSRGGQPLKFSLSSQDTPYYTLTAKFLQEEWAKLGVKLEVHYFSGDELQSAVIANHDYDSLLYGISLGVDPDMFAYWDSSQASVTSQGHLNLSEYKSTAADLALESGRTRSDPNLRAIKYQAFLNAWRNDAPAAALYQSNFLYITRGPVFNYQRKALNTGADRFYNAANWEVRQKRQTTN